MADKPKPGLMDQIGSSINDAYLNALARGIGVDRSDAKSLEAARAELMAYQREVASDPNPFTLQGLKVGDYIERGDRMKVIEKILAATPMAPIPPVPMGGGGPATRDTGASDRAQANLVAASNAHMLTSDQLGQTMAAEDEYRKARELSDQARAAQRVKVGDRGMRR